MKLKKTIKNKDIRLVGYNNWKQFGQFSLLPAILFDHKIRKGNTKPNNVYIISLMFIIWRLEISLESL